MHDVLTYDQFIPGRRIIITPYGGCPVPRGEAEVLTVTNRWNTIGGRWCDLTVRAADGTTYPLDTRDAFITSTEYTRDYWCPECRSGSTVEDEFTHSWYERDGEHETTVTRLACGHEVQTGDRITGAAPGAPYAGPGAPVARSYRARDLAAAASPTVDPWAV